MRFRCERDVLAEAISTVARATSARSGTSTTLSGILLEVQGDNLHLAGTDLDLTIQTNVAVAGSRDGSCVVKARLAADIVRSMPPGAISIEGDEDDIAIRSGRSNFSVRTYPAPDFPRLAPPGDAKLSLTGAGLASALTQVVKAASSDDNRPMLTGVLMASENDGLRLVATDSYRLALRDLPGLRVLSEGQKVVVPAKGLSELQRMLNSAGGDDKAVDLYLGNIDATFEVGPTRLTTRLITGDFPNYQQLMPPSYPNRAVLPKAELVEAVKRMKLLVEDLNTPVRMAFRPDGVELNVITPDLGHAEEELDATYEGEPDVKVAFNPAYLIDGIEAVGTEEVILETVDATKPAMIRPTKGDDFRYLLMPVRVA
ncbi:MAG: DNA polymerase III subunit beta [Acidimicrobiales bacterium]